MVDGCTTHPKNMLFISTNHPIDTVERLKNINIGNHQPDYMVKKTHVRNYCHFIYRYDMLQSLWIQPYLLRTYLLGDFGC